MSTQIESGDILMHSVTFPRLLLEHARVRPAHPAYREKYLGIWQTESWSEAAIKVRELACGLASIVHAFIRRCWQPMR
jgi:long-subunit acyl-CoA synthetase (AMP-forming)